MASANSSKVRFADLGRPTLRGVRKCPKCGTVNGTRGLSCKNQRCDVVFKNRNIKKNQLFDCVKLVTGDSLQLYSVRVRDRGADYRGFVQLPTVVDASGNILIDPIYLEILLKSARCYIDACDGNSPIGAHQDCMHIHAAVDCTKSAEALELNAAGIETVIGLPDDIRNELYELIAQSPGPLVQRVTKNVVVVKCAVSDEHPLGYLHFTFPTSARDREELLRKVHCSCRSFKNRKDGLLIFRRRCVHFYACVIASVVNNSLGNEFKFFAKPVVLSQTINGSDGIMILLDLDEQMASQTSELIDLDKQPQLMSSNSGNAEADMLLMAAMSREHIVNGNEIESAQTLEELIIEGGTEEIELDDVDGEDARKRQKLTELSDGFVCSIESVTDLQENVEDVEQVVVEPSAMSNMVLLQQDVTSNSLSSSAMLPAAVVIQTSSPPKKPVASVDEAGVLLAFEDWLSSVTERINMTMHYQFDGNPDALVFHIPQKFFDSLQQRMSFGIGGRKKRLPNSATSFERRDSLPMGTFMKYTWHLTSLSHVKQIFDTPQRSLDVTRRFIENRDGTYDLLETSHIETAIEVFPGKPAIRPSELKTFLKVGSMVAGQCEPTPFVLEWIPDILPLSHIGELRIVFQYGHQRNGCVEQRAVSTRV